MQVHSRLAAEIAEIPELARRRIHDFGDVDALGLRLRARRLRFIITIGRGSSDAVCEAVDGPCPGSVSASYERATSPHPPSAF